MKPGQLQWVVTFLMLLLFHASATVLYVDLNSTNPTPPYADWATAATNIQDAVDASTDGDQILVTNGIYQTGGRVVYGSLTNRVVVNKAVTVQSVNGPAVTTISGNPITGDSAVRCVYMTYNTALVGFTLSGGATRNSGDSSKEQSGGGIWCESSSATISNCVITGNSATQVGGGAISGTLNNCVLNGNSTPQVNTQDGGGAGYSTLNHCNITGNSSQWGGGVYSCTLNNCVLSGNYAFRGGAARSSTLNHCTITNNCACAGGGYYDLTLGGGLDYCTANDCTLIGNSSANGGGAANSTLNNCLINQNSAYTISSVGGGTINCTVNNCTLVGNLSNGAGGGDAYSILNNSVIYYNSAPDYNGSTLYYCCTPLFPTNGFSNITNSPQFVNVTNDFHLSPNSPCINAGSNGYVNASADLDGNPRIVGATVDIGAYEYQAPTVVIITQPLSQTNAGEQSVSFNVVAVSPFSLSYQWQFNETNIVGATNSTLVISDVQSNSAGVYCVVVSNGVVSAVSSNASLTVVWPPPNIVTQPTNLAVVVGSNAVFSMNATSYYTMSFQWQWNGTNLVDEGQISGATNPVLTIFGAQTADDGAYQVTVANNYGVVTSLIASLAVYDPVQITGQPASQALLSGSSTSFTVAATGTALNYQWYFNGTSLTDGGRISGSTSPALNIANVQTSDTGNYTVVVTNLLTAATSSNAALAVYAPVQITGQPTSIGVFLGDNASFTVTATGTALGYQWYFNGIPILDGGRVSGSASPTLDILNVQSDDFGGYTVVVTNLLSATNSLAASLTLASVRYVDLNSTNPASPYADWSTAATNIQDAIDVSTNGDLILVTNGVYQTGGRVVYGSLTNRIVINKAVTVQSVNGPAVTIIQGYQVPGVTNGDSAVRCVYLTNKAALIGFTITNGATRKAGSFNNEESGGGVWCESNDDVVISNCVITLNVAAWKGGGAYQGTFINCALSNNSVTSTMYAYGGGAYQSYLVNCTVADNSVHGSWSGYGGGTYNANLTNCVLSGNSSFGYGGGAYNGSLVNCTITGNFASFIGGGTYYASQINCINYFNICPNVSTPSTNYYGGSFSYCCTTPFPGGTGNIASDPLLASASHLSINSPCRGAGSAAAVTGADIDGEPWANPPSIGCDELYPGTVSGNINVGIMASDTNRAVGYAANFQANISGPVYASKWDFGDGMVVSNKPYMSHTWSALGDYPVVLAAYNDSYPTGQTATLIMHVYQPTVFYVVITNKAPMAPYDSWAKAATNIQNAIDVANSGNLILVSNGVYKSGSRITSDGATNRVAVTQAVTLQSINGSAVTLIDGGNTLRCVYLTNGAVLDGFTLTNGTATNGGGVFCTSTNALVSNSLLVNNTASSGGGACSGTLSNCTLMHNSYMGAYYSVLNNCVIVSNSSYGASYCTLNNSVVSSNGGGGISFSTANNCKIIGNTGGESSGGAYQSTLNNCTIVGQMYTYGAYFCKLRNCILYYNPVNYAGGFLTNCCTTPLPSGPGNFTNAPIFVNLAGGDLHLLSNSPCINAGNNTYVAKSTDLDGNPRIVGGTVDMGAYEFENPASVISYAWLQQYGLTNNGSVDYTDTDHDGMNNWQEWIAGTNPTNALSVLKMTSAAPTSNPAGLVVTWQSVNTRTYYLQRSTDLTAQPAFSTIQSNIVGQAGTTSYTDTTATNAGPYFYRVGVQ